MLQTCVPLHVPCLLHLQRVICQARCILNKSVYNIYHVSALVVLSLAETPLSLSVPSTRQTHSERSKWCQLSMYTLSQSTLLIMTLMECTCVTLSCQGCTDVAAYVHLPCSLALPGPGLRTTATGLSLVCPKACGQPVRTDLCLPLCRLSYT